MNWIQENKFTATLAGITAVGSAALLYLSMQESSEEKAIIAKTKKLAKEEVSLKKSAPFPSKENLEAKKEAVIDYANGGMLLQNALVEYRPASLQNFQPSEFGPMLTKYRTELNGLFESAKTELPEQMFYGFEAYASRLPKKEATGELKYQMDAAKWLFTELAKADPKQLINVYRPGLAVESSAVSKPVEKKSNRKNRKKRNAVKEVETYKTQPIELAFTIKEKNLVSFMESVANSKSYFYTVRGIRIVNEDQNSPSKNSAKFEASTNKLGVDELFPEAEGSDSGGFILEPTEGSVVEGGGEKAMSSGDEEVEPAAEPMVDKGDRILKQILGSEHIYVSVKFELIIFESKDDVVISGSSKKMDESAKNEVKEKEGK